MNNCSLKNEDAVKDLGMQLDSKMIFNNHIEQRIRQVCFQKYKELKRPQTGVATRELSKHRI